MPPWNRLSEESEPEIASSGSQSLQNLFRLLVWRWYFQSGAVLTTLRALLCVLIKQTVWPRFASFCQSPEPRQLESWHTCRETAPTLCSSRYDWVIVAKATFPFSPVGKGNKQGCRLTFTFSRVPRGCSGVHSYTGKSTQRVILTSMQNMNMNSMGRRWAAAWAENYKDVANVIFLSFLFLQKWRNKEFLASLAFRKNIQTQSSEIEKEKLRKEGFMKNNNNNNDKNCSVSRQVSTRGYWFDFDVRWFIIPVKKIPLREPQCNSVLISTYSCPSRLRSVFSPFGHSVCGLMGYPYGENQQSHVSGYLLFSIQKSELKNQIRKRAITRD